MSGLTAPAPFFLEHTAALAKAARLGPILDLACGRGRHSLAAAEAGARVVAVDRNREFLVELRSRARRADLPLECLRADIENPPEIPMLTGSCGAILVFRFLFRPLAPKIVETLAPGGLLLYETFTREQLELGTGPKNPAHLLAKGELPALFPELEVDSYREDVSGGAHPVALAHLAAYKPVRTAC